MCDQRGRPRHNKIHTRTERSNKTHTERDSTATHRERSTHRHTQRERHTQPIDTMKNCANSVNANAET